MTLDTARLLNYHVRLETRQVFLSFSQSLINAAELRQRGFEVFRNLARQHVGIGQVFGIL